METGLVVAVVLALAFAFTNGVHDAANAIATLVATRAARPGQAIVLAMAFSMLGPLLVGSAVASTIAEMVQVPDDSTVAVVGSGLVAAVAWNLLTWWLALPSSSGHALVGGLVGAALVAGGGGAVNWGGLDGWHPVGVIAILVALAVSPFLGGVAAFLAVRGLQRVLRRGTVHLRAPVNAGQWAGSALLALSHAANDAHKSVGVVAALLLATGHTRTLSAPAWVTVGSAAALTVGTAFGGWRIVHTLGHRIFRVRPLDGLASQTGSSAVILVSSLLGAPVSTTQVVASSVLGVGLGRERRRHVRWSTVGEILLAWLTTLPASASLAAGSFLLWRWIA